MLQTSTDLGVNDTDLRDILAFLTKVVQVVDQSFQDVYTLAIELAYVGPEGPRQREDAPFAEGTRPIDGNKPLSRKLRNL